MPRRVHDRAVRWLRRHKYFDDRPAEDRGNEPAETTPIDGFSRIALAGGTFLARPFAPREREDDKLERTPGRFAARRDGFDVHCGVRVAADDDEGCERLVRYPRRGRTHRVMTPMEFMARLAILVPPPFFPLVRFRGVFAARSSWRAFVTPKPPAGAAREKSTLCPAAEDRAPAPRSPPVTPAAPSTPAPPKSVQVCAPSSSVLAPSAHALPSPALAPTTAAPPLPPGAGAPPLPPAILGAFVALTTLTVKHWHRLLDGVLFATSSYVDWAVLLQRTFGFDALRCPKCGHRMRITSTDTDP